jgi:iron(III) transport system permease protein
LVFALGAFVVQRRVLGARSTLLAARRCRASTRLPTGVRRLCFGVVLPWMALTLVIYVLALTGGFVETWGRDYTPTLRHYVKAFGVEWTPHGILWAGAAWNSFWTPCNLAIAAPLTAGIGIRGLPADHRNSSARAH